MEVVYKLHLNNQKKYVQKPYLNTGNGQISNQARKQSKKKCFSPCRLDELAAPPARLRLLPVHQKMTNIRLKKLPLLAAVKPENVKAEKDRFMRANFNYNPYFMYKGCTDDKTMNTFNYPSDRYLPEAILILENTIAHFGNFETFEKVTGGPPITRAGVLSLTKQYLANENLEDEVRIILKDDLISRGSFINSHGYYTVHLRCANLRENCLEGLLNHEVVYFPGTHYLRSYNNKLQPWATLDERNKLDIGPVNPTEEGLASLHSIMFSKPFLWRIALLYYTTYKASKMSFKDTFSDLSKYVENPDIRWEYCMRAKRGQLDTSRPGSFCKDQVYLVGVLQLLKRRKNLDFPMLLRLGKISFRDVNRRCVTDAAKLDKTRIPKFMEDLESYHQKLDNVVKTNGLTDILSHVE
ncbi:putative tyrosine carboxypeptidase MATCAP2 isoform X2 [Biomphalaria glabrata]|uniref:Tyrosine carboxypeptidase MATCAP2 isoform X2 n=1 Tax=Biomphalaria glabrata TaxID=6526 RepID=A0A9W3AXP6_BIOGL|nr:putative tyrosine carboxypeptidase MATCAP2 isoform X2 [Biomphalaria glabrata]